MSAYSALVACLACERRTDVCVIEKEGAAVLYPNRCLFCNVEWGAEVLPARDGMDEHRDSMDMRYREMNEETLRRQERRA